MVSTPISVGKEPTIKVKFVGNESISWLPSASASSSDGPSLASASSSVKKLPKSYKVEIDGSQSSEASSLLTTDYELKQQFIAFTRARIVQLQGNPDDSDADLVVDNQEKCSFANLKRQCLAVLAVALDPAADIKPLSLDKQEHRIPSLDRHFGQVLSHLTGNVQQITEAWYKRRNDSGEAKKGPEKQDAVKGKGPQSKKQKQTKSETSDGKTGGRSTADKNAQAVVPTWYNGRCILSGFIKPQGAHIVPVRAVRLRSPINYWDMLSCFWPLPALKELVVRGREVTNIIPLCPDAHALWDQYHFAIRPIEDPSDPQHRIFIQMVWLKDLDTEGGLSLGAWDHDGCGSIADFRRGENGMYPPVKHGDVYEIFTADPDARPLPSLRLLEIQYGVHKILAGIQAAGALKIIFSDDPPDDAGPVPAGMSVPTEWEYLLEAAVDTGVLSVTAARRWGNAFIRKFSGLADGEESD